MLPPLDAALCPARSPSCMRFCSGNGQTQNPLEPEMSILLNHVSVCYLSGEASIFGSAKSLLIGLPLIVGRPTQS